MTENKAIGFCILKAAGLMFNCGIEDDFTIIYDNKSSGTIKIKSQFTPEGGDLWSEKLEKC
jgi:hypothetical protein